MFGWWNFHKNTIANFTTCEIPKSPPDFASESGSAYWDLGDRVVRWADHWGVCNTCYWQLWPLNGDQHCLCGECLYSNFRKTSNGNSLSAERRTRTTEEQETN